MNTGTVTWRGGDGRPVFHFSHEGHRIAVEGHESWSQAIPFTYLFDGRGIPIATLYGQFTAFSPDGKKIATTNAQNSLVTLWDENGKILYELPGVRPTFSPEGKYLLLPSHGMNRVTLFDFDRKGASSWPPNHSASHASFTPNGKNILVEGSKKLWLYDLKGTLLGTFNDVGGLLATNPTGDRFIAMPPGKSPLLWKITSGWFGYKKAKSTASLGEPEGTGAVSFFYTLDGSKIIKVPKSGPPSLWDPEGKYLTSLGTETSKAPTISPDGKRIVLGTQEGLSLWNEKGELLRSLPYYAPVQFSADGKYFVSKDGLWDREGNLITNRFAVSEGTLHTSEAAISPEGKRILVRLGAEDKIVLWESGFLLEEILRLNQEGGR